MDGPDRSGHGLTRRFLLAGVAGAAATAAVAPLPAWGQGARAPGAYAALALQVDCHAVNGLPDRAAAQARMLESVARIDRQIAASKGFIRAFSGLDTRLVVLPEYVLTSFPWGETIEQWRDKAALEIDGPVYDALSKVAQDRKVFLAGNAYEIDPAWPELYFQTNFLIAPSGDVVLRYRRLISMFAPSPYDIWDAYLDRYGLDGVFPVAETEIGRIAGIASEEILYPEIARAHAIRGAEIFFHPTSEVGSPALTQKDIAKRARAIENMAYVVSANTSAILDSPIPADSTDAMSKVIGPDGLVLAEAGPGETMVANAAIDIGALREKRGRPGMSNLLTRQPYEVYAQAYAGAGGARLNGLLKDGKVQVPTRDFFLQKQRDRLR